MDIFANNIENKSIEKLSASFTASSTNCKNAIDFISNQVMLRKVLEANNVLQSWSKFKQKNNRLQWNYHNILAWSFTASLDFT